MRTKSVPSVQRFIVPAPAFAIAKVRRRNRASGSIARAPRRRSSATKEARIATAPAPAAITAGEPAPERPPSMNANVAAARNAAPSATPPRSSSRPCGSVLSRTTHAVAASARTTIGTLTRKIARQPNAAMSAPPASGPAGRARLPMPAHTPIARACSRPSGKAWLMIASVPGRRAAAPAP